MGGAGIKAVVHQRAPMTMLEVLEVMLTKSRVEAEDAQVRAECRACAAGCGRAKGGYGRLNMSARVAGSCAVPLCSQPGHASVKMHDCWTQDLHRLRLQASARRAHSLPQSCPACGPSPPSPPCSACSCPRSTAWRACCCCKGCRQRRSRCTARRWPSVSASLASPALTLEMQFRRGALAGGPGCLRAAVCAGCLLRRTHQGHSAEGSRRDMQWWRPGSQPCLSHLPPLAPVERNKEHVRADALQQLHTLHNLADLLGPDGRQASSQHRACMGQRVAGRRDPLASTHTPLQAGGFSTPAGPLNVFWGLQAFPCLSPPAAAFPAGACPAWRPHCGTANWRRRRRSCGTATWQSRPPGWRQLAGSWMRCSATWPRPRLPCCSRWRRPRRKVRVGLGPVVSTTGAGWTGAHASPLLAPVVCIRCMLLLPLCWPSAGLPASHGQRGQLHPAGCPCPWPSLQRC